MRPPVVLASLIVLSVLVVASPAAAVPPSRFPSPPLNFTAAAGEICPFPIQVETTSIRATETTFPDGHIVVTGKFKVRVTNLTTDESLDLNFSGPLTLTFNEDGTGTIVTRGPFPYFLLAGDIGGPGIIYTHGRTVATVDLDDFSLTSLEHVGESEELCPVLAEL